MNPTEVTAIENKIAQIEAIKNNQIVVSILKASDAYPMARFRTSLLLFFLFSFILGAIFQEISHLFFLLWQIPIFFFAFFIAKFNLLKKIGLRAKEVESIVYYHSQKLFQIKKNDPAYKDLDVLVLLSNYEKQIEIIFDEQYQKTISLDVIKNILQDLEKQIQKDGPGPSLLQALEQIEKHLPVKPIHNQGNTPNHIIWADFSS